MSANRPVAARADTDAALSQSITPELRTWIVAQAQAGFGAPAVLQSMLDAGWSEEVATYAMEHVLREHLDTLAVQQGHPAASRVPEPDLAESPGSIDVGDRRVDVLMAMAQPRVVLFGNLLSPEECDAIIDAARPRMARSLTVATRTGGEEVNDDRTSNGMFFQREENPVVARLEARIARLVNWPLENGEGPAGAALPARGRIQAPLRLLRPRGARHADHPAPGRAAGGHDRHLPQRSGKGRWHHLPRRAPGSGSAPWQRGVLQLRTPPTHPRARSMAEPPVVAGDKWIATKWLRERRFE